MARGERFELRLDSESDDDVPPSSSTNISFVKDITERSSDAAVPPQPPRLSGRNGFPTPRVRPAASRFKQEISKSATGSQTKSSSQRGTDTYGDESIGSGTQPSPVASGPLSTSERERIDRENKEFLARMSESEIAREREELLSGEIPGLSASLIERLLKRSNVFEGSNGSITPTASEQADRVVSSISPGDGSPDVAPSQRKERTTKPRTVTFEHSRDTTKSDKSPVRDIQPIKDADQPSSRPSQAQPAVVDPQPQAEVPDSRTPLETSSSASLDALPPSSMLLHPANSAQPPPQPSMNIPAARAQGDLDPSSPSFLSDLHQKYFPELPTNPNALSWMQSSKDESYSPEQDGLPPSAIRFDFRGSLVPPSLAQALPTTLGLHHHGTAPGSAGYTVSELARLQRSAVPAQRCIAHQTLGRILFRLGKGEFGEQGTELCEGLWVVVGRERVVESLVAEAGRSEMIGAGGRKESGERGNDGDAIGRESVQGRSMQESSQSLPVATGAGFSRSAWALATEAVWLWQRGGGRGGNEYATR